MAKTKQKAPRPLDIAYYDEGTGWTVDDGDSEPTTIEEALENLRDDGRVTIEVDKTVGTTRVIEGTCCGERFVLVGVVPILR